MLGLGFQGCWSYGGPGLQCCSGHTPPLVQEVQANDAGLLDAGLPKLVLLAAHRGSNGSGFHHLVMLADAPSLRQSSAEVGQDPWVDQSD